MILTAKAFLDENPHPSEIEVKRAISGNLCRCTGYIKIVEAILSAVGNNNQRILFTLSPCGRGLG